MKRERRGKKRLMLDAETFYYLQCMAKLFDTTPRRLVAMLVNDDLRRWRDKARKKSHEDLPH